LSVLHPAPSSFTCTESTIKFEGHNYVPGNVSAKYVHNEKTVHNVTITPLGESPFEFCAANSSRIDCRSFACPVGWAQKSGNSSSTCELKPCSKHECCVGPSGTTNATLLNIRTHSKQVSKQVSKPGAKNASLINIGTDSLQSAGHEVASEASLVASAETAGKVDAADLAVEMANVSLAGTPPWTREDAPATGAKEAAGPPPGAAREVANATDAALVETEPSAADTPLATVGDPSESVRTDPAAPNGDALPPAGGAPRGGTTADSTEGHRPAEAADEERVGKAPANASMPRAPASVSLGAASKGDIKTTVVAVPIDQTV